MKLDMRRWDRVLCGDRGSALGRAWIIRATRRGENPPFYGHRLLAVVSSAKFQHDPLPTFAYKVGRKNVSR
jgi:hypothetical protein